LGEGKKLRTKNLPEAGEKGRNDTNLTSVSASVRSRIVGGERKKQGGAKIRHSKCANERGRMQELKPPDRKQKFYQLGGLLQGEGIESLLSL